MPESQPIDILIPDLGNFSEVDVIELLVQPGQRIAKDTALLTLETDKATMEVPAPAAGVVQQAAAQHHGRQQRRRREVAADRLEHRAQSAVAEGQAAVLFGQHDRGPAEADDLGPERRVVAERVARVAQPAQCRHRRLGGEEFARRLGEQPVFFVHDHAGSPSTRRAIRLSWISEVPPPSV